MDNKKLLSCSNTKRFICEYCDYNTGKKSSWSKHIKTNKHISKSLSILDNGKVAPRFFCECGKKYQFKSGLCKHKKKCLKTYGNNRKKGTTLFEPNLKKGTTLFEEKIYKNKEIEKMENSHNNPEINSLKEELNDIKYLMKQFITQSTENHTKTSTLIESQINSTKAQQTIYNNCNNQNMTINVFLNEQCKDAINITEFIESLQIQLQDLENTKEKGLVSSISNIILKGLNELDIHKRPIHCSDIKREILYIKDEEKWEKDQQKNKIKQSINDIANKQRVAIKQWTDANPKWMENEKLKDQYVKLVNHLMQPVEDTEKEQNKIIKKVSAATIIEKD